MHRVKNPLQKKYPPNLVRYLQVLLLSPVESGDRGDRDGEPEGEKDLAKKNKNTDSNRAIVTNRKASYEYFLEDKYEAGLVLNGWEVKSMRHNRVNLKESYIIVRGGELFLVGSHVSPLKTTSTHVSANPTRDRKLLLNRLEINRLIGAVERKGYSMIPMRLYWSNGKVKLLFALARGKKQYDKRASIKSRDIEREQARETIRYR